MSAKPLLLDDGFEFSKQMSRNHVMHRLWKSLEALLDPASLASEIDDRNFFVLDLDCPGALEILMQVRKLFFTFPPFFPPEVPLKILSYAVSNFHECTA